ncbi:Spc98 family-domain-containing protein [Mycena floridula]|nr:Spc98 family-domain-containing protein [Mycena floridula]
MIAEVLLVLAGHRSSLFPKDYTLNPAFASLLHPGEQQCLQSLGLIAFQYRKIKASSSLLSRSSSRYICALCSKLNHILRDEYETLVVDTEAKVLKRDSNLVASGSFVPLSSIRAVMEGWDAPLTALVILMDEIEAHDEWKPGPLIDLLTSRSNTGVHRIADIFSQLSHAVQRVWRTQLTAFVVHGSLSVTEPLATAEYVLLEGSMPSCVSGQSRDSIAYIGRAISTVKNAKWQKQLPRNLAQEHTSLIEAVLPENQHNFDRVIAQIRTNVGEWLWMNVLTQKDVEEAVESLANYFLLRNGEFSLSLIREIERLKLSRFTMRTGNASMIRDQDLNLALLRASLGTSAQHDPNLSRLRFSLPSGPLRPLLPSLGSDIQLPPLSPSTPGVIDPALFSSNLLGTPLTLNYTVSWPLDLFLYSADLTSYGTLFSFLIALRRTHTACHSCWTSLSNAQRARRRWTGLGEGGTVEDLDARKSLLRCSWGVVRDMGWFFDCLLGYVMIDVVDVEFGRLKKLLGSDKDTATLSLQSSGSLQSLGISISTSTNSNSASHLDFTTLRMLHSSYLDRLVTGCLLNNLALTSILRPIFDLCERFVSNVERWGGDVLPALLFEGSLDGGHDSIGTMVRERHAVVLEINEKLHGLFVTFYEQLSLSASPQPIVDASKSKSGVMNASMANYTTFNLSKVSKGLDGAAVRRHIERLLLRLDFNGRFSKPSWRREDVNILAGLG